jgi:hypothetical protein
MSSYDSRKDVSLGVLVGLLDAAVGRSRAANNEFLEGLHDHQLPCMAVAFTELTENILAKAKQRVKCTTIIVSWSYARPLRSTLSGKDTLLIPTSQKKCQ